MRPSERTTLGGGYRERRQRERGRRTSVLPLATASLAAALLGAAPGAPALAAGPAGEQPPRLLEEVTPELMRAVEAGRRYLWSTQAPDGSWEGGEYRVAVTALVGLALLAGGSTPEAGPEGESVRRALRFVLRSQVRSGLIVLPDDPRPMYGHGFALLFLAQCYGQTGSAALERQIEQALRRGVREVARAQSRDGGWFYTPDSDEDEGSVTITQVQGLRAARNAGIHVERAVIEAAVDYIRRSQDPDGGIRYTVRSGRSSLALTAAGMAVLQGAGEYNSPELVRALEYLRAHMEISARQPHFEYTHFYAAQALFQVGGSDWERYFPRVREEIIAQQSRDGSWPSSYGRAYGTAMALLVLELPFRYLPIYTR
ncbi:MAG: hypothetical protein KatS3mg102_0269 [Planctomycetota bacterium]|nr:MAG: hypothetical protein KatS3mg102_0269 [Planctomycetota bacterium]